MTKFKEVLLRIMRFVRRFFPLVLLVHHLKHNLLGLFYWLFFYLLISGKIGHGFGLNYLFLSPEYRGETSFFSFFLLGFSLGGLTMAFHSYSYMRLASRFPFLATVHKPFVRFSINNSLIPLAFCLFYIIRIIDFQRNEEFQSAYIIASFVTAVGLGFVLFVGVSLLYFFPTNKNLFELKRYQELQKSKNQRWIRFGVGRRVKVKSSGKSTLYWYVGKGFKVIQCRSTRHYAQNLLQSVFDQNRISTSVFEITTIIAFVLIGLVGGKEMLDVPAGVSVVLLMTILMMLLSAWMTWLRVWAYPVLIFVLFFMNYSSIHWGWFKFQTQAYGLNYEQKVAYTNESMRLLADDEVLRNRDLSDYLKYLEAWKKATGESKPKLIVINTSGGGSRSAAWVFEVLRTCDSMSNGKITKHIAMITGASGGTVGAAYFRSLMLEREQTKRLDVNDPKLFQEITNDLLNKLAFAASTNDMFFRYQSSLDFQSTYNYDRAMAFEADLNENTGSRMNRPLSFFKKYEQSGVIPNLIISPSVVNDGRRLLISSQGLSFLMEQKSPSAEYNRIQENIDFNALFGKNAGDLRLTSALRMNATFPYVLPMTSLPTQPEIQVMDAGARDNFGTKVTVRWLMALENWIKENTSGVVVLQVRDNRKMLYQEEPYVMGFADKFTAPVSNVFRNFPRIQDYDQDELWKVFESKYAAPIKTIQLNLREVTKDKISLSWHLTEHEKLKVKKAIKRPTNGLALLKLYKMIESSEM